MFSPIILIVFFEAPTVPSDPNPKNNNSVVPSGCASISSFSNDVKFTSSTIPRVNLSFLPSNMLSKAALICPGVVSFEERP